jgi:hypothetical protein
VASDKKLRSARVESNGHPGNGPPPVGEEELLFAARRRADAIKAYIDKQVDSLRACTAPERAAELRTAIDRFYARTKGMESPDTLLAMQLIDWLEAAPRADLHLRAQRAIAKEFLGESLSASERAAARSGDASNVRANLARIENAHVLEIVAKGYAGQIDFGYLRPRPDASGDGASWVLALLRMVRPATAARLSSEDIESVLEVSACAKPGRQRNTQLELTKWEALHKLMRKARLVRAGSKPASLKRQHAQWRGNPKATRQDPKG